MESLQEVIRTIEKYDSISFYEVKNGTIYVHSNSIKISSLTFRSIFNELKQKGYVTKLQPYGGLSTQYVYVVFKGRTYANQKILTPLILSLVSFAVTIVSLYYNSFYFLYANNFYYASIFIASVVIFLAFHSLGHFIAEKKYNLKNSLPIFLPAPIYGTYGLVARLREIFIDRIQTFDFAFLGITFSILPTFIFLFLGLEFSKIALKPEVTSLNNPFPLPFIIYIILEYLVPKNSVYLMHPLFVASIVNLLLLFISIAPITQLDGGFMAISLIGPKRFIFYIVSLISIIAFIIAQLFFVAFLALYLTLFFKFEPLNTVSELDRKRKIIFAILIVLWILIIPAFNSQKYSLLE